ASPLVAEWAGALLLWYGQSHHGGHLQRERGFVFSRQTARLVGRADPGTKRCELEPGPGAGRQALCGVSETGNRRPQGLGSRNSAAQLLRRTAAPCARGKVIRPASKLLD